MKLIKHILPFIAILILVGTLAGALLISYKAIFTLGFELANYFDNDPLLNSEARNSESSPIREIEEVKETQDSDELQLTTDRGAFKVVSATTTAYCLKGVMASGKETYLGAVANARISAYTTRPEEGTTCVGYYGENLCFRFYEQNEKLIACPSKYGTSTLIEIKGIKYRCADRMAISFWQRDNYFDIYMGQGEEAVNKAKQWGIKNLPICILTKD